LFSFRRDIVGVFECPKCLAPISHMPRYQSEFYARHQDVCDLGDFFFAAATGSGLKARQAALRDKIRDNLMATSDSNLLNKTCCQIFETFAKAIDSESHNSTSSRNPAILSSHEIGLLEAKVAILSVLKDVNSKDDDSAWIKLCEQIAACRAFSRQILAALCELLRTRGAADAAEMLNADVLIWSYERDLWKRCSSCMTFHQSRSCRSCSGKT
jgi:hypothetical protein